MNKFPTSYEIFGLDCLGEEASESLKMEYIFHCVDDCISETLNPYKEIFNSDATAYGGSGHTNARLKQSKEERVDGRDNSIQITIPPLGCAIFTCTPILKEKD